jgi:hypothetical protein
MNRSILTLGAAALLGSIVLTGCSEQPFGPEAMGGDAPAGSALTPSAVTGPDDPTAAGPSAAPIRLQSDLTATSSAPTAGGSAEFVAFTGSAERRFRVEVKGATTYKVVTVVVTRSGEVVFAQKLELDNGHGVIDLRTSDKEEVPAFRTGDEVQVRNLDGKVILFGALKGA